MDQASHEEHPVSLWCVFPQVQLNKGEERQEGRWPGPSSDSVNDKIVSPSWMPFLDESLKKVLKVSAWGKQIICKTERFFKYLEGCSTSRHVYFYIPNVSSWWPTSVFWFFKCRTGANLLVTVTFEISTFYL